MKVKRCLRKASAQRFLSLLLSVLLCMSMMPAAAFAEVAETAEVTAETEATIVLAGGEEESAAEDAAKDVSAEAAEPEVLAAGVPAVTPEAEAPAVVEPMAEVSDVADADAAVTSEAAPATQEPAAAPESSAPVAAVSTELMPVVPQNDTRGVKDDPDPLVDTPLGKLRLSEVKAYAATRDARNAALRAKCAGGTALMTLSVEADSLSTQSSNFDYSGTCWVEYDYNGDPSSDEFWVQIDDEWYRAWCLDAGLPAPADDYYTYYAEYDPYYEEGGVSGGYYITVDCADAEKHESQEWVDGYGCQDVGGFYIMAARAGLSLTKSVAAGYDVSPTGPYSLEGATYGLYWYRADAEARTNPAAVLTIGANGVSNVATGLTPAEGWYVREISAPAGYTLDEEIHAVDLAPGSNVNLKVSDKPIMDPVGVLLRKVKATGETYYGEDGQQVRLQDAVYRFDYYDTLFYNESNIPSSPARTWYLKTNENGYVGLEYADSAMIDGYGSNSALFREPNTGDPAMPYGTLVIREVAAPTGYKVSDEVFIGTMRPASNGSNLEWVWNKSAISGNTAIAQERVDTGSLIIKKTSTNSSLTTGNANYSLAGATFEIYDNASCSGAPAFTRASKADGTCDAITNLAPYSTWWVKETAAPAGFTLPAGAAAVKQVTVNPSSLGATTFEFSDAPLTGAIQVAKVSAEPDRTDGNPNYSLAGAVFDVYDNMACAGSPKYTLTTDVDGKTQVVSGLAIGSQWTVKERTAPANYKVATATETVTVAALQTSVATVKEDIQTGVGSLVKRSADESVTGGNAMYSVAGAIYGVWDNAACEGEPAYELTTREDGTTNKIDDLLVGSVWYVKEIVASEGYKTDPNTYEMKIDSYVQESVVEVEEAPVFADAQVALNKVNAAGEQVFNGNATFEGAEYTFSFYAGKRAVEGEPDAVWVGAADVAGRVNLEDAQLVSGTEALVDGKRVLPLGTLTVRETKAPVGYLLSDAVYVSTLVYDKDAESALWTGDVTRFDESVIIDPEDQKLFGISVFKDIQGVANEISPEGIQFEITYKETGEIVEVLTIDATGHATTGERALPCGTYEVREIEATVPAGIQPYSFTSGTGDNLIATVEAEDDDTFPLYEVVETGCVDYTEETIEGEKTDEETNAPIAHTEFALYAYTGELGMKDGIVAADPSALSARGDYWEEVGRVMTDAHGVFDFGMHAYGVYMVVETQPEWHYLSASESEADGTAADPFETARIFVMDKAHPYEAQMWLDQAIQIECNVDKSTIEVTSAGLVSKSASEDGEELTNVGIENYRYDVSFDNGATNTYADEYWVVDEFNMAGAPYDLRVTSIYLPVVANDSLPTVQVLVRTNKSAGSSWAPAVETEVHQSTLCDGSSRFNGAGWKFVGEYSSAQSATIDVATLGLAQDEYLTGLCLYYGAVEKGFASTTPLSYLVTATHALAEGIVIPNTASSHITRNWADRDGEGGLEDDAVDSVKTIVIGTFEVAYQYELKGNSYGHIGVWIPQMGDNSGKPVIALIALAALVIAFLARRKDKPMLKDESGAINKNLAMGLGGSVLVALIVVLIIIFAGKGCASDAVDAASTSSSASASALASASSAVSASASASSAEQSDESPDSGGNVQSEAGVPGGSGNGGGSSESEPGSGSVSEPSPAPDPTPAPAPVHEHSWTWVSDVVTVTDRDAWDEPVYRTVRWCPKCDCEVSLSHNEDMLLEEKMGHSIAYKEVLDHYEHHDAITHTEDHGHYACSCGATK